jgi:predicted nucleic acid-binding protein
VILYLDTSALVKLYVDEPGRAAVLELLDAAVGCATARIAYVEARAAFARRRREGGFQPRTLRHVVDLLDQDWAAYTLIEVGESLVRRAGVLAERHGLRGYDAVHLAAALELAHTGGEVVVACFDERLRRAVRRAKLRAPRLEA